uniref:Uncharacterized protein n=1 Tax=Romanomermis culicivorax TaxID=13658 RepID=A0A915J2A4_ROMCU
MMLGDGLEPSTFCIQDTAQKENDELTDIPDSSNVAGTWFRDFMAYKFYLLLQCIKCTSDVQQNIIEQMRLLAPIADDHESRTI